MKVGVLERKRADYYRDVWDEYDLLYAGGHRIEKAAERFLKKNPAETDAWWALRRGQFHYKNVIAEIVDEIASQVLQAPLEVARAKQGESRPEPDRFYTDVFLSDPTGCGEEAGDLSQLAFDALIGAMVNCESWAMVCFPGRVPGFEPRSRAEQEAAGELRATVRLVDPRLIIDYTEDERGIASVMLRQRFPGAPEDAEGGETPKDRILWTRYTRTTITEWELRVEKDKEPDEKLEATVVTPEQTHRFWDFEGIGSTPFVPLMFRRSSRNSLWLLDKLGSLAKEGIRKRNGLGWYSYLCAYPWPYHKGPSAIGEIEKGEEGSNRQRAAHKFVEIEENDEVGYLEPTGGSLQFLSELVQEIDRDLHRSVQNMAAAQGPGAAAQIQSAASKERDAVAKSILAGRYAKRLRPWAAAVMALVSHGRGDVDHVWEVGGADQTDLIDARQELESFTAAAASPELRQSQTLMQQLAIKAARALMPDADRKTMDDIEAELSKMTIAPLDEEF